jgi:hypothetical protein
LTGTVPKRVALARPPTTSWAHGTPLLHRYKGFDLAAEAERGRTPRTPGLTLAGVWLVVAAAVVLVLLVIGLTLHFVS